MQEIIDPEKLRIYLPHYLGCDVLLEKIHPPFQEVFAVTPKEGEIMTLNSTVLNAIEWHRDVIKPIVRPLNDMTDAEAIEVAKMALDAGSNLKLPNIHRFVEDTVKVITVVDNHPNPITHTNQLKAHPFDWIEIDESFTVREARNTLCNQSDITLYFLSKYFDIWGLIRQGLAIDKTTMK